MDGSYGENENVKNQSDNEFIFNKYPIGNIEIERYDTGKINRIINYNELFNIGIRNLFLLSKNGRVGIAKSEYSKGKKSKDLVFMLVAIREDDKIKESNDTYYDNTECLYFFKKEMNDDYCYNLTKTVDKILDCYKEYVFDVLKIQRDYGEKGCRIYLRLRKWYKNNQYIETTTKKTIIKRSIISLITKRFYFFLILFSVCYVILRRFKYNYN